MKALVKEDSRLHLQEVPVPEPGRHEVLIRVRAAALCRTDQLVMSGRLPACDPLIPGHELSGQVAAVGEGVRDLHLDDPVTVHPLVGCGACGSCRQRRPEHCPEAAMIGVDRDGAFAEYLCAPARATWRLPADLGWKEAAYAEPLAAALGIFRSGLRPEQSGWVTGTSRIALLTTRLLQRMGFSTGMGALEEVAPNSLDYVVETGLHAQELDRVLEVLAPGGSLIAKSRHLGALPLAWSTLVRKDLRIQGLYYGGFAEALALLSQADVDGLLADLVGPAYALDDWRVFVAADADDNERHKRFLVME